MPALAEILKTVEEVRKFKNVSSGVHQRLIEMKDSIFGQIKQIDNNTMGDISTSVRVISHLTKDLIDHKKKAVLSDSSVTLELLALLKL